LVCFLHVISFLEKSFDITAATFVSLGEKTMTGAWNFVAKHGDGNTDYQICFPLPGPVNGEAAVTDRCNPCLPWTV
jgi:hypothetical protein